MMLNSLFTALRRDFTNTEKKSGWQSSSSRQKLNIKRDKINLFDP